jgi:peptide/nickel transport system permease protein
MLRAAEQGRLVRAVAVGDRAVRPAELAFGGLVARAVPGIFGGAIVTEQIFRVPGVGELLVTAIGNGDTPVVTAVLFIFAVLVVVFNLIADVLYTVLDPRLRLA